MLTSSTSITNLRENGWRIIPGLNSEADALELLLSPNAMASLAEFSQTMDVPALLVTFERGRINLRSAPLVLDSVLARVFKQLFIGNFSGGKIEYVPVELESGTELWFKDLWTTLSLRMEMLNGGSNGATFNWIAGQYPESAIYFNWEAGLWKAQPHQ